MSPSLTFAARSSAVAIALLAATASHALEVEQIASGLSAPVFVAAAPGSKRLFILERDGVIRRITNGVSVTAFLDIRDQVDTRAEGGLLGLAFPPEFSFAPGERFFVYYTATGTNGDLLESRVASYTTDTSSPTTLADASSGVILYRTGQPRANHNGGTIAIRDGFLYLGLGDGGGGVVDQSDNAQDPSTPLGKILRFDRHAPAPWTPESWATGFRNPFRFSFDSLTGDLYIGDVGQASLEEIDVEPAASLGGLNYGWDVLEGTSCFDPDVGEPACDDVSLVPPVFEYAHLPGPCGGSVTGGSVYRGTAIPSLVGRYFFADFCRQLILSFEWDGAAGSVGDVLDHSDELAPDGAGYAGIVALVNDSDGELIIVDVSGRLFRVVPEPAAALQGLAMFAGLAALGRLRRGRPSEARTQRCTHRTRKGSRVAL